MVKRIFLAREAQVLEERREHQLSGDYDLLSLFCLLAASYPRSNTSSVHTIRSSSLTRRMEHVAD